jgi:xanthine dehydrogenase accessory factor
VKAALLSDILAAKRARRPVAVVTRISDGSQRLVEKSGLAKDPLAEVLEKAFRYDKSGIQHTDEGEVFVTIHNPPLRLVIIGAVLIAQALIPMAQATGYDIWVIDPRGAFATGARFPEISLHAEWPDEVVPQIGLDQRTAFVALTHDPKIDDAALALALRSDVFYIGALGSRKTHAGRIERLKELGFDEHAQARIQGPIGLDIGAVGAQEIALSIMAQIVKALRIGL